MITTYVTVAGSKQRDDFVTVTVAANTINGSANASDSIDGGFSNFNGGGGVPGSVQLLGGVTSANKWFQWDFGWHGINPREFKYYQNSINTHGGAQWHMQGSQDASSWTDLATNFVLGAATTTTVTLSNTTRWRYLRLIGDATSSGTLNGGVWFQECEWQEEVDDYEGGDRTSIITVSTTLTKTATFISNGGDLQKLVDGTTRNSTAGATAVFTDQTVSGKYMQFDFAATRSLLGFVIVYTGANSDLTGTWKFQYFDGSSWVDHETGLSAFNAGNHALGGAGSQERGDFFQFSSSTPFASSFRITGTAGSISDNPWWNQIFFFVDEDAVPPGPTGGVSGTNIIIYQG